ncbi:uncharacterized protein LOC123273832, partial [Cotesia glomerata]|uniref:uncharacterized protein LOC123273832 n=1 Tax=Cotesia glomerata TaxID=32391 RepID=UPI001D013CE3
MAMQDEKENIFLIGDTHSQIDGNQLPSNLQVLQFLFHNLRVLNHNLRDSKYLVYDELITFWQKVKIPTQQKCRCIAKIEQLYNDWRSLQKSSSVKGITQTNKEEAFSSSLKNLFDIAHNDALNMIDVKIKNFLLNQRKPCRVGYIDEVEDPISESSEPSSQIESSETNSFSQRSLQRDPSFVLELNESPPSKKPRGTIDIFTPKLCTMLDKCKISDRNATGLLISFLEAVGMDASQYIVNRTSIKQKREKFREDRAAEIQHRFKNTELSRLIIHWDGKHLPDITGRNFIERLPIIISAEKETKILSIPKLENSTGRAMADAVFDALQEYGISEFVVGLCCDTTASNTGQFNGAAVLIEQALERDLLLLPCRHHILEVVLKAVFDCQIFNSSGPNVPLFVRFRKEWDALDLTKFESGINDPIIYNILENDILDIREFAETQLTLNHDRDDYLELLKLTLIFIGVVPDNVVFRVPGAMHQA